MSSREPRLRGSAQRRSGPYPLGQLPDEVLRKIGQQLIHRIAVGNADISGDDFGMIFASAVGGEDRSSPLGIADVVANECAWSVKTVKSEKPFNQARVRLISGRNSPNYSLDISDPLADISKTGGAVLSIWNARVNESLSEFKELRVVVFIRNLASRQFAIFEQEAVRFTPTDYRWETNKRGNLEGFSIEDDTHRFTWQPHGSQFTIVRQVPPSVRQFSINREVRTLTYSEVQDILSFTADWITIHEEPGA